MSTITKNKSPQGIRYTDAQKKDVVDFILSYNAANGRGGQSKAGEKFKISQITIASWLKAAGASAPQASAKAKAPKAAKVAKAAKAPKAKKAAKAPKAAGKSKAGTRYTDEQKKEITDFVASYNAANGRGGQSKAAAKFKVSPLTVMAWLKAAGGKRAAKKVAKKVASKVAAVKSSKAAPSAGSDSKLGTLLALSKEIASTETALAQLIAKRKSLVASL